MIKSMDFHTEGVLYYNSAKFLLLLTFKYMTKF